MIGREAVHTSHSFSDSSIRTMVSRSSRVHRLIDSAPTYTQPPTDTHPPSPSETLSRHPQRHRPDHDIHGAHGDEEGEGTEEVFAQVRTGHRRTPPPDR